MDMNDMKEVLREKMLQLEEQKLQLAELRQKVKNDTKRLVMLAQQYPDAAKAVNAPTEVPTRGGKDD